MELAVCNDKTGLWDFTVLADAIPPVMPVAQKASFPQLEHISNPAVAGLMQSFVTVTCRILVSIGGFFESIHRAWLSWSMLGWAW